MSNDSLIESIPNEAAAIELIEAIALKFNIDVDVYEEV